ncbi:MAG TPA: hypothetical protein P5016_10280 [Verrucomicrobiales bacterium]|nr:hypothetical protein [Verrucomicrobiae bacterium]MCP5555153.1 hypothetical protein [Akkermansiaceae bacterium]HRX54889.1 hypothetical protein [Verrucomicrobiales bacterium]
MSKGAIILKSDAGGRVLVPVERQVELVREFERSRLSGPWFAEIAGVKYQTFAVWRHKHGTQARDAAAAGGSPASTGGIVAGGRCRTSHHRPSPGRRDGGSDPSRPASFRGAVDQGHWHDLMLSFAGSLKVSTSLEPLDSIRHFQTR